MTVTDFQIFATTAVGILVVLGGAIKWLFMYVDTQQKITLGNTEALQRVTALNEANARTELSARLHDEIRVLRVELSDMRAEKRLYLRRILQLEAFIHAQPGISIPPLDGWPPE